ncbi:MAG: hypothetical protein WBC93_15510, partial [Sulfitobacter sp.]
LEQRHLLAGDVAISVQTQFPQGDDYLPDEPVDIFVEVTNTGDTDAQVSLTGDFDGLTDVEWTLPAGFTPELQAGDLPPDDVLVIEEKRAIGSGLLLDGLFTGDVDGDSLLDLVGRKVVLFGNGSETRLTEAVVDAVGDVNNDGIDDLVIETLDGSVISIVFGGADLPEIIDPGSSPELGDLRIDLGELSFFGFSFLGDVNGDGVGDFSVRTGPGGNAVIFGGLDDAGVFELAAMTPTEGFRIKPPEGIPVITGISSAGDLNNDSFADVVVSLDGTLVLPGVDVIFGGESIAPSGVFDLEQIDGDNGIMLRNLGGIPRVNPTASVNDINADGIDDMIIAGTFSRGISVVFGSEDIGVSAELDVSSFDGADGVNIDFDDSAGVTGAPIGDINGDGYEDLYIGAHNIVGSAAYVVFGGPNFSSHFSGLESIFIPDGFNGFRIIDTVDDESDSLTQGGASVGDFNGDGIDDVGINGRANPFSSRRSIIVVVGRAPQTGAGNPETTFDIPAGVTRTLRIQGKIPSDADGEVAFSL